MSELLSLSEIKTCKFCDKSYSAVSKHEKRCKEVYQQLIRNEDECTICQTSYPFIWRHLSTKHANVIARIQQGSVSMAKKKKLKDTCTPTLSTKKPHDQMMPKSIYECRICGKQMKHPGNLRQHEAACLRRQSLALFEVSNKEQENVGTDPDLDSHLNRCQYDTVSNNTLPVSNACRFCKKQINDRGNKIRHETVCATVFPKISGTMCMVCKLSFASFHHVYQHIKKTHRSKRSDEGKSRRQCQYCKKVFGAEYRFGDNVERHESTCAFYLKYLRGHRCLVCNFTSKTHSSAKVHARTKHNDLFNSFMNGIKLPERVENVESKQETNNASNEEASLGEKVKSIGRNEYLESFELIIDENVGLDDHDAFEPKGGQPESVSHPNPGIEIIDLEDDSGEVPDKVESKQETSPEKAKMNEKVKSFECNECPKSFELRFELEMHSKKQHHNNATPLKKLRISESFSLSHIKSEDEKVDLDDAATTLKPIVGQHESMPQPTTGIETQNLDQEDDSGEVTKLYKCPFCQTKWLNLKKAQNHIVNFHRIPIELQSQFGITIKEIIV